MTESSVRRLVRLSSIPRAEMGSLGQDDMQPMGDKWREHLEARGFVCPPAWIELADLQGEHYVDLGGWGPYPPPSPDDPPQQWFLETAEQRPELADANLIAVLGCDGDLVLLAKDGCVFLWVHDDTPCHWPLAGSFEALIDALLDAAEGRRGDYVLDRWSPRFQPPARAAGLPRLHDSRQLARAQRDGTSYPAVQSGPMHYTFHGVPRGERFVSDGVLLLRADRIEETPDSRASSVPEETLATLLTRTGGQVTRLSDLIESRMLPGAFRTRDDVAIAGRYVELLRAVRRPLELVTEGPLAPIVLREVAGEVIGALMPYRVLPEIGASLSEPSPGAVRARITAFTPMQGVATARAGDEDVIIDVVSMVGDVWSMGGAAVHALVDLDFAPGRDGRLRAKLVWPAGTPRPTRQHYLQLREREAERRSLEQAEKERAERERTQKMSTEELVCDAIARKDEGAAQKVLTRAEETSRVAFDSALAALFSANASPAFVASVLRPMLKRLTLSAEHWQLVAEGGVRLGNNAIRDVALARGKSASTRAAHAKAAKR